MIVVRRGSVFVASAGLRLPAIAARCAPPFRYATAFDEPFGEGPLTAAALAAVLRAGRRLGQTRYPVRRAAAAGRAVVGRIHRIAVDYGRGSGINVRKDVTNAVGSPE